VLTPRAGDRRQRREKRAPLPFETGKSPQGVKVLAEPLDLMKVIQE